MFNGASLFDQCLISVYLNKLSIVYSFTYIILDAT